MNNSDLQARKVNVIARGQGNVYSVYIDHAKNIFQLLRCRAA